MLLIYYFVYSFRAHPTKVKAIFIRRVQGVNEAKEKDLNKPSRFEKAFEGISKDVWKVFDNPKEVDESINALTRAP